ncbi:MAG: hypothetical protein ACOYNZ_19730 [Rhodoferax sp.]
MSAKKLSTVATDVIESYGNTAKNVIHAYRAGGERVVGLLQQNWNRALRESRSKLAAGVASNATATQQAVCGYYIKGLTLTTNGAQEAVSQIVRLAGTGVERVAANASRFEVKTGVTALNKLAQASLPGALALSTLATRIEQKSAALASRIAGDEAAVAVPRRAAPAATRKVRKAKAA